VAAQPVDDSGGREGRAGGQGEHQPRQHHTPRGRQRQDVPGKLPRRHLLSAQQILLPHRSALLGRQQAVDHVVHENQVPDLPASRQPDPRTAVQQAADLGGDPVRVRRMIGTEDDRRADGDRRQAFAGKRADSTHRLRLGTRVESRSGVEAVLLGTGSSVFRRTVDQGRRDVDEPRDSRLAGPPGESQGGLDVDRLHLVGRDAEVIAHAGQMKDCLHSGQPRSPGGRITEIARDDP
jgi:hypothetical protein